MNKIVAVMANSQNELELYQAVHSLSRAAERKGFDLKIEIQKNPLIYNRLEIADILSSDAVILTGNTPINDIERFSGHAVLRTITAEIISDPFAIFAAAEAARTKKTA